MLMKLVMVWKFHFSNRQAKFNIYKYRPCKKFKISFNSINEANPVYNFISSIRSRVVYKPNGMLIWKCERATKINICYLLFGIDAFSNPLGGIESMQVLNSYFVTEVL